MSPRLGYTFLSTMQGCDHHRAFAFQPHMQQCMDRQREIDTQPEMKPTTQQMLVHGQHSPLRASSLQSSRALVTASMAVCSKAGSFKDSRLGSSVVVSVIRLAFLLASLCRAITSASHNANNWRSGP